MTWTAPITFVAGVPLAAAQLNAMQANLLETAVAKATASGRYMVTAGANSLVERWVSRNTTDVVGTTTSTSYTTSLTSGGSGSQVIKDTGAQAVIGIYSYVRNSTAGQSAYSSYRIDGATTRNAVDADAVMAVGDGSTAIAASAWHLAISLTPGSNTFSQTYRVTGGTGTFDNRRLTIMPF